MLTVQYPGSQTPQLGGQPATTTTQGPNFGYAYDTMGRLNTMTDLIASATIITGSTYDPANRLLSISGSYYNETRSYNTMGQLTGLTNNSVNLTYAYSSTQNNGKITGQTDNISGEQVVYAYDALNRLASAAATSGSWGQSYGYDGFGNLQSQTVTAGSAPSLSVVYNASNNLQTTDCADANGNIWGNTTGGGSCGSLSPTYSYDASNRILTAAGGVQYGYAPGNKRVWKGITTSGNLSTDVITFWSATGQKLGDYNVSGDPSVLYYWADYDTPAPIVTAALGTANYYFGHKQIAKGGTYVGTDRLGSFGKYYPWGQEKPSATANGTEKFTGYFRDSETGLDYAEQRYHQPGMGRFLTPDPYQGSSEPDNPGSWNRYSYVGGDPIEYKDADGREECDPNEDGDCPEACPAGYYWDEDSQQCLQDTGGGGNDCINGCVTGQIYDLNTFFTANGTSTALAPNPTALQTVLGLLTSLISEIGEAAMLALFTPTTLGTDDTLTINGIVMDPDWVEANCSKVGDPVVVPSTNPNYKGGQSIEQTYLCPDGELYTIHILQKKSGKQGERHVRPGKPKYGGPAPVRKPVP
jgi:RHS repeat-associated protein